MDGKFTKKIKQEDDGWWYAVYRDGENIGGAGPYDTEAEAHEAADFMIKVNKNSTIKVEVK